MVFIFLTVFFVVSVYYFYAQKNPNKFDYKIILCV